MFMYIDKLIKKEIRRVTLFMITSKKLTNLTKKVKCLYSKNYATQNHQIEEDIRKWKDNPVLG